MPKPTNSFTTLAGVPVHYDRPPVAEYGSRGKPHTFYCLESFEKQLDTFFAELWLKCPLGKAEVITSAGAYVDKPGQHGNGRALDIDGIFWASRDFVTLRYPKDKPFYLGVEAILKKHFGTVLSYNYNADHHDHFHVDNGSNVGFGPSKQTTACFVGAALNHVFGRKVKEGPVLTEEMKAALREVLTANGIPTDLSILQNYFAWLDLVAAQAWGTQLVPSFAPHVEELAAENPSLRDMFRSVIHLINTRLADHPDRKAIESSVNFFGEKAFGVIEKTTPAKEVSKLLAPKGSTTKFSTPPASSQTANKKGSSQTTGLQGTKTTNGKDSYVVEAVEKVKAKRDNKPLGEKTIAQRRVAKNGVISVEQADYCWKNRKLPSVVLLENFAGFPTGTEIFKGKATYFGKFDNMDEGTGSPLWGTVQTNSSVFGVSLKRQHLLDEGLAVEDENKILRPTPKGLAAMVEVYFPATKRLARLPLVDVGPGPTINAVIDLTVAATAFLQAKLETGQNETGSKGSLANIDVVCRLVA